MPQGLENEMIRNGILYAGEPEIQELEVETYANFAPGRLVITGTAQWQCGPGAAASVIILGVADVPSDKKLTAMQAEGTASGAPTVTFTAGEQIRVLRGDIVVKVLLKSGQTITVGEKLESAALGMVQTASVDQAVVGYALENLTTTTTCKWILMKMQI